jgi:cytochrome c biogenesis protein CcmG, thiol:disulfide interchange protein DsbE
MKNIFFFAATFIILTAFTSDVNKKIPSVKLEDMDGKMVNTAELSNDGKPMVINFWATWCSPCKKELNTIAEVYDEWQEETGVKIIAISVDDQRTKSRVKPHVNGASWEYDILLDPNGDFKRAMGVNNVPHTFLVDGEGNIVWQHNNYSPGDEDELYNQIKKLVNK